MTFPEKGPSRFSLRRNDPDKEPVVLLRDPLHIKEDIIEKMHSSKDEEVKFGVEIPIFIQAIHRSESILGIFKPHHIRAEIISQNKENRLKIVATIGPSRIGPELTATFANGKDGIMLDGKIGKLFGFGVLRGGQLVDMLKDPDKTAKEKVNKKLGDAGKVDSLRIGEKLLECTVKKITSHPQSK